MTWRRTVWLLVAAVVVGLGALTVVRLLQANSAARQGKAALFAATADLKARRLDDADLHLRMASKDFRRVRAAFAGTGPVLPIARLMPLLRIQVRAMDTMTLAGQVTADSGLLLLPTARRILTPSSGRSAEEAMRELATSKPAVAVAVAALIKSQRDVHKLDGYRLLGPLAPAHRELEVRLDDAVRQGRDGERTLSVLLSVAGVDHPSSYLLLSQNPDEPRPTGGYMGTYGVLIGRGGRVRIARYDATGTWNLQHPQAAIPVAQSPFPFRYASPPHPQSLGNSNATPDWPSAAALAARIWQRGGEAPVDGVVTFTPALLTRLLAVLGPTAVPGFPDVVTAQTVDSRLEFYVHGEASLGKDVSQRKLFVGALAHAVLDRALHARPGQLPDLGRAVAASLKAREAAVWSAVSEVQTAAAGLGWDGALPAAQGDFYADAEFAFASKNGRRIQRTFDHTATLAADGSGRSETTMVLRDTAAFVAGYNIEAHEYVTPYGPLGGSLLATSDPPDQAEADLAGHPTGGWLRTAEPLGQTTLRVGWQVPDLLLRRSDGTWEYRLTWLPQPGHRGDVLRVRVAVPAGWHWVGGVPPGQVELEGPYTGHWVLAPDHR